MTDHYPNDRHYKTARLAEATPSLPVGTFVSVRYNHTDDQGQAWFFINQSQHGPVNPGLLLPKSHLTEFVL